VKPLRDGTPWLWTLAYGRHEAATHGYEPTREAGMSLISPNVRNRGQAGKHLLPTSFSQFDPTTDLGPRGRCTVPGYPPVEA
jgi:hypothetical protein